MSSPKLPLFCLILASLLLSGAAVAQQRAFTADKREVLLFDDGTWRYAGSLSIPAEAYVMPPPPWNGRMATSQRRIKVPSLRRLSVTPNSITDDKQWFEDNGLSMPVFQVPNPRMGRKGTCPQNTPTSYRRQTLVQAISGPGVTYLVYGRNFSEGRFLVITDAKVSRVLKVIDFANYTYAPSHKRGDRGFVAQSISWVWQADGVLYVSHGHRTYAASSMGKNAYITAIDLASLKLLWRSRPLVANARNFLLAGDTIITGYGFTDEPDHLILLNRYTGATLRRIKLKTGPDYILAKKNRLFVRTYNRNYVFALGVRIRRIPPKQRRRPVRKPPMQLVVPVEKTLKQ